MASPEIFQPIIHYSNSLKKITAGFQRGRSTGAVFLDIQKAFDRVWMNKRGREIIVNELVDETADPDTVKSLLDIQEDSPSGPASLKTRGNFFRDP
ncbi:hypothetical protein TNCV_1398471 [Trichonephila clavipes]|nr:hypothetical protein TNCV_1398471 [Trichonephila clavipes]